MEMKGKKKCWFYILVPLVAGAAAGMISGSGMAGAYSSNLIKTRKVMQRLYLCGDETYGVSDEESLTAARVSICAGHEANMAVRLLLGETDV